MKFDLEISLKGFEEHQSIEVESMTEAFRFAESLGIKLDSPPIKLFPSDHSYMILLKRKRLDNSLLV